MAIKTTPVAEQIPFDNTSNSMLASDVQTAIEEAKLSPSMTRYRVSATDLIQTTAATYSTMTGMSVTPVAGTYLAILSVSAATTGVNGSGDIALFLDSTEISGSARRIACQTAILGLITLSTNLIASSLVTHDIITVNGSQVVTGRFRENVDDTLQVSNRTLTLIRIG